MNYLEPLPDSCPPSHAKDVEIEVVWRIVSSDVPTMVDFASHAARGWPKRPIDTDCGHASCSVFTDKTVIRKLAQRLPKKRIPVPHLCELPIPKGLGKSVGERAHLHLWMYADAKPLDLIVKVEKFDDAS